MPDWNVLNESKLQYTYLHDTYLMMLWVVTLHYKPTRPCQRQVNVGKAATRHFFFSVGLHIGLAAFRYLRLPVCVVRYPQIT